MRETPISSLERTFLLEALSEGKRIDVRGVEDRRHVSLAFGTDYGCCWVQLGGTIALAQVSAYLSEPATTRPNEGILRVNVDFGSTCAPRFQQGPRFGDNEEESVEVNRVLERCLKESRCLDMESLCVVADEKVWCVRLDVQILSHCGNAADAASAAGLAALCHFRRPDVTLRGDEVTVHPPSERDPIPLAVHHHPVCSTFAFFNCRTAATTAEAPKGAARRVVVADPSWQEEAVMEGKIVFGVNPYREICTLHLAGNMLIDKDAVLRYAHAAARHAKTTVDLIKARLEEDAAARAEGRKGEVGLSAAFQRASILASERDEQRVEIARMAAAKAASKSASEAANGDSVKAEMAVVDKGGGVVEMVPHDEDGQEGDMEAEEESEEVAVVKTVSADDKFKARNFTEVDLEEENGGRGWYQPKW